jgi:hypothetical protein
VRKHVTNTLVKTGPQTDEPFVRWTRLNNGQVLPALPRAYPAGSDTGGHVRKHSRTTLKQIGPQMDEPFLRYIASSARKKVATPAIEPAPLLTGTSEAFREYLKNGLSCDIVQRLILSGRIRRIF